MPATLAGHTHRFVPPADGVSATTLLLLHGTGGDENDLLPLGQMILPGANMLSPRGNVSENGAPRFFRRLAEGVFDVEDLHRRTSELAAFVRAATDEYGLDGGRMIAVGFSNGANIAASLLLSDPELLSGAVLFRAMVPFEPSDARPLEGVGVLIAAGRADPLIPSAGSERLAALLRERGADVDLRWMEAGHGLTQADVSAAREWLAGASAGQ